MNKEERKIYMREYMKKLKSFNDQVEECFNSWDNQKDKDLEIKGDGNIYSGKVEYRD